MLMGAVPDASAGSQAGSVEAKDFGVPSIAEPDLRPATAAATTNQEQAALSTTTPSVAPPEPVNPEKLPNEMATVASAVSPPVAKPQWEKQAEVSTADPLAVARDIQASPAGSLAIAPRQNSHSLVLLLVLGILTLGVYPLVVWLVRKRRAKP